MLGNSLIVFLSHSSRRLRVEGLPRLISIFMMASLIAGLAWTVSPVLPAYAAVTVIVDRTDDPAVTTAGSGAAACTAAANDCSLRGATLVANANPGSTIDIPAGTYVLTIDGHTEAGNCGDATIGDLDIAGNNTTMTGAGAATTIIEQTMPHDRVICVDQFLDGNFNFSISGVTITGGRETFGVGGGGMISGAPGDMTTVTNVIFSNNQTSGGGSPVGGGLGNGAGGLTISGSTFGGSLAPCASQTNINCANQSTGSGGGVYYSNNNIADAKTLSVTTSTFENNVSTSGNGGGLITTQTSTAYSVTNSTFKNNTAGSAAGGGGGIYNESGTLNANTNTFTGNQATGVSASGNAFGSPDGGGANITANFNRIVNNSGSSTDVHAGSGSTNSITNNWWGCDGGPGATGCDNVGGSGTNNFNPWIVLKTTASPSTVNYGDATTLTASFLQNSSGSTLTSGQIAVLISLPVTWTNAAHGTLSNQQTSIQSNGTATATFTAGSTSADCGNVGKGEAEVDNVQSNDTTATASVTIDCPDLQVSKTNNVSGSTTFPTAWTWTLTGSNAGPGQARYSNGQTILTDNLPNSGLTYGVVNVNLVSGAAGTIDCSINITDDLTCAANGAVTINSGGSFTASFSNTPSAAGQFVNPRTSSTCAIDPNNNIPETSDSNNTCANTVTVNQPPSITSANSTTFTVGSAGTFTVTTTAAYPVTTTISETGGLPGGVTFTDNHDGTATLAGTPAALAGGQYHFTIKASNGIPSDATQSFTLTVDQAPAITSANHTTFTVGSAGTFNVTTTGFPTGASMALSETGSLPSGVAFTDNGDGSATLAGTPGAGTGGSYSISIKASNGIGSDAVQSFTLTVDQAPAITSANTITFTETLAGTFTVTTTGYPINPGMTIGETGSLPSGVTFTDNGDGTATLAGTPAFGTHGSYPLTISASNGVSPAASQSFTLVVKANLAITSADHTTFTVGSAGTFTVTTTGTPIPSLIETNTLPSGVTFTDNGDGTGTLAGTPGVGTTGIYNITFTAHNGVVTDVIQNFTLTVTQAPAITSADHATFSAGSLGLFTVTTTGFPSGASMAIGESGALPSGVSFTDNGDGTAALAGTPGAGTGGVYILTITASNGVSPDASQNFTLTVNEAPAITSVNHVTFTASSAGTFTVTTHGYPVVTISRTGSLPSGVTFTDNGDGTATLAGVPAFGTGGTYPLTLTAHNSSGPDATQSFTLTVDQAPAITSAGSTGFSVGSLGTFAVTTTGFPGGASMTIGESGALPSGVTFTDNGDGTATLAGTPGPGTGGAYNLTITASNGVSPDASQSFTLNVNQDLAITSADNTTFTVGSAGIFSVTVSGFPTAAISETGSLPGGVTLTDNGDNTATLAGTPSAGTGGTYSLTIKAHNGVSTDVTQNFTLTVDEAPGITSAGSALFLIGQANSFTVTSVGFPLNTLSESGSLPGGLTFTDNGNNTASLSGTPNSGTSGLYNLVFTAHNTLGPDATQNFTLTVENVPSVTNINSVADTGDGQVLENEHTNVAITQLLVVFGNDMNASDAQNTANYSLIQDGVISIPINSSVYSSGSQTATLSVNGGVALPNGSYALTVKSSIHDTNGVALLANFVRNFVIDTTAPIVLSNGVNGQPGGVSVIDNNTYTTHFTSLAVTFDKDVQNPSGDSATDDVTNPANYLLVSPGTNGSFDTVSCSAGVAGDDIQVPTGPVTYDNHGGAGPFTATVVVNNGTPLPRNLYRLFVCGTTSILDLAGNPLNGGTDTSVTFRITDPAPGPTPVGGVGGLIPVTGFAPDRVTVLPPQTVSYADLGNLWLEIPRLGVKMSIVGVPQASDGTWDVSWLGQNAGWLNGSAYPTWSGNSVLTGHVWNADNTAGPFRYLNTLWWGDKVIVHAGGAQYIYEVRSVMQVGPGNTAAMLKHEDRPWLTLVTCLGFDQASSTYKYRVLVRAVLVDVK